MTTISVSNPFQVPSAPGEAANGSGGVWQADTRDGNTTGADARIDVRVDPRRRALVSPRRGAFLPGDTPSPPTTRTRGSQDIGLEGLGQEYSTTNDPTLF